MLTVKCQNVFLCFVYSEDDLLSQSIRDDNKLDGSFGGVISLSFSKLAPMVRHKKLKALRHALER